MSRCFVWTVECQQLTECDHHQARLSCSVLAARVTSDADASAADGSKRAVGIYYWLPLALMAVAISATPYIAPRI